MRALALMLATAIVASSGPMPAAAQEKAGAAGKSEKGAGGAKEESAITLVSKKADAAGGYKVDYAVPAAPAYTILGATPSGELTAYFGRNVQWDLLTKDDNPAAGVAIRPFWLLGGRNLTLEAYGGWLMERQAATVLSFAGGITGEKDKRSAGLAVGVHTSLTSGSDPRLDPYYIACSLEVAKATQLKRSGPAVSLSDAGTAAGGKAAGGAGGEAVRANRDAKADAAADLAADAREYLILNDPAGRRVPPDRAVIARRLAEARSDDVVEARFLEYWASAQLGTPGQARAALAEVRVASQKAAAAAKPPPLPGPSAAVAAGGLLPGPAAAAAKELDYTEVDAQDGKLRSACMTVARVRYLNRREWLVGAGGAAKSPDTKFSEIEFGGVHLWSSYRVPLGRQDEGCNDAAAKVTPADQMLKLTRATRCAPPLGNLALFGRYIQDEKLTIAKDTQEVSDTYVLGASFRRDARDGKWGWGLSAAYNSRDWHNAAFATEDFWRYSADISYRIATGVFLNLQGGTVSGDPRGEDDFAIVRVTFQEGAN